MRVRLRRIARERGCEDASAREGRARERERGEIVCVDSMARESATRARATMGDANGKKIPARAREMILTCAARVILSGHDGVTAREVADVMRRTTCERTKRALVGEDGTNHAREESAFETLRDASGAEADARGGGGSGWTRRGEGGARDVVFDLAGREYRPPRSWLGASRGGGKTKESQREFALLVGAFACVVALVVFVFVERVAHGSRDG